MNRWQWHSKADYCSWDLKLSYLEEIISIPMIPAPVLHLFHLPSNPWKLGNTFQGAMPTSLSSVEEKVAAKRRRWIQHKLFSTLIHTTRLHSSLPLFLILLFVFPKFLAQATIELKKGESNTNATTQHNAGNWEHITLLCCLIYNKV